MEDVLDIEFANNFKDIFVEFFLVMEKSFEVITNAESANQG